MDTRIVSPSAITSAMFAALGAMGSIIFPLFVCWPVAFLFGMGTAKVFNDEEAPRRILAVLWAGLGAGIGSMVGWFLYYPMMPVFADLKYAWVLFGPAFTALFFMLGGLTYLSRVAARRNRAGGTNSTPPTSSNHGSSTQYHRHSPTPEDRRKGFKRLATTVNF